MDASLIKHLKELEDESHQHKKVHAEVHGK